MSKRSGVSNNKGNSTTTPRRSQIPEATELAIQNLLLNSNLPRSEYRAHFESDPELFGSSGSLLRTRIQSRVSNLCRPRVKGKRRYKLYPTDPTHISPPPPSPSSSPAPTPPPSSPPSPSSSPAPTPPRSQHTEDYQPTEKGNMDSNNLPTKDLNLDKQYRSDNDLLTFFAEKSMTYNGTSVTKIVLQKPIFDINDHLMHSKYQAQLDIHPTTGLVDIIKIRRPTVSGAMWADAKIRNTDEEKTKIAGEFIAVCDPLYQNQAALENEMRRNPDSRTTVDVYQVKSMLYPESLSLSNKYFNPLATKERDDLLLDVTIQNLQNPWLDYDEAGTCQEEIQFCPVLQWEFHIESSEQQVEVSKKKASRPVSLAKGRRITHAG
jgi:hypothetical protein